MSEKGRLLHKLVDRAMRGAETLPASDLADLNEAAALALTRHDPRRADMARHTAGLLRQALTRQLEFTALLKG